MLAYFRANLMFRTLTEYCTLYACRVVFLWTPGLRPIAAEGELLMERSFTPPVLGFTPFFLSVGLGLFGVLRVRLSKNPSRLPPRVTASHRDWDSMPEQKRWIPMLVSQKEE